MFHYTTGKVYVVLVLVFRVQVIGKLSHRVFDSDRYKSTYEGMVVVVVEASQTIELPKFLTSNS